MRRLLALLAVDPEIKDIALYQVARYSQVCRIFAPVYRQITVQGLTRQTTAAERVLGDKDLLEAWKQYLAKYNDGSRLCPDRPLVASQTKAYLRKH